MRRQLLLTPTSLLLLPLRAFLSLPLHHHLIVVRPSKLPRHHIKMEFQALLLFALIPTYFSLVLFLITAILITHYGILGDFFIGSYFTIIEPTTRARRDYYIQYDIGAPTNAAIFSTSTSLMAAIIAIIAWYKLRRLDMDLDMNRVRPWLLPFGANLILIITIASSTLLDRCSLLYWHREFLLCLRSPNCSFHQQARLL